MDAEMVGFSPAIPQGIVSVSTRLRAVFDCSQRRWCSFAATFEKLAFTADFSR
jgi:hypothetical protein